MKRITGLLLTGLFVASLCFPAPVHATAAWMDSGYSYRKEFTVTGSTAGAQTDYPFMLTVYYGNGADSGGVVYLDSKSQTDFDDLRFTTSDGQTAVLAWLENKTDSSVAYVWVKLPTIPASPSTVKYYIYYGNSAAASGWSAGGSIFTTFDDFERGVNTDEVGGAWTETSGTCEISTSQAKDGTRSAKITGGAAASTMTTPLTAQTQKYAVREWVYKETATVTSQIFGHGNGTNCFFARLEGAEALQYYNGAGAWAATGTTVTPDAWRVYEFSDLIFATPTFDIWYNNASAGNNLAGNASASATNVVRIQSDAGETPGDDFWIDDYIVRKWVSPEPTISAWATAETVTTPLVIQDVKIFTGYKETDDWLITVRYIDIYEPYYDTYDVRKYFVLQLLDAGSNVKAETPVPSWGNRCGSIYLSAAQTTPLTYGGVYSLRLRGIVTPNPSVSYSIASTDWAGSDLVNLDSWVITSSSVIGTYYSLSLTTYITERGEVLNSTGASIFSAGIAGLSQVRPNIYQTYSTPSSYTSGTTTQTYRQSLKGWQANIGADGTVMLTRLGGIIGVDGSIASVIIFLIMLFTLAALAFPAGHTTAAMVLSLPLLGAAVVFGMDLIYIGLLVLVAAFLAVKNFWLDKGT